jgi:ppGpp synthetase/RelA/SpoT-type nucleotidyltranferase
VIYSILAMKWNKSEIDSAGKVLTNNKSSEEEVAGALKVLDGWRAIHNYPLSIFINRLKRVSENHDKNTLSVQRLKRLSSIIYKLKRSYQGKKPSMKLSQMQDIAGCRVVMSNVELAEKLFHEDYLKGSIKHNRVNYKDYITYPKDDGYRSIHLVYRYKSDKKGKEDYNGLLIEVQIRSKLQHLWATAIETVGFIINQPLKFNEGEKEWRDFFRLVSSAFAIMEKKPLVPDTPRNKNELYSLIKKKEKELNVIKKLRGWTQAIKIFEERVKGKSNEVIFLLELDMKLQRLTVLGYSENQKEEAIKEYAKYENAYRGNNEYDAVLVGADTISDLKIAYPNYFADTEDFVKGLGRVIGAR